MKKISQLVTEFLENGFFSPFYIIDIELDVVSLRYSSLPYTVVIDSISYTSDSSLVNIDGQKMSTVVDKETFKIKFADPEFLFRQYCDTMSSNGNLKVRVGFFNTDDTVIYSTNNMAIQPGNPILDSSDMVTIYEGSIDKPMYTISNEDGITFELECSAPLGTLDANNVLYTTTQSLKQRIPYSIVDTCFDEITLGGKKQELLWGRNIKIE